VSDERATIREVHFHQRQAAYIRRSCAENSRTYLGRSAACRGFTTARFERGVIARQKSAEGIVVQGYSFDPES
jgi:hypothetical protein